MLHSSRLHSISDPLSFIRMFNFSLAFQYVPINTGTCSGLLLLTGSLLVSSPLSFPSKVTARVLLLQLTSYLTFRR